MIDQRPVPCYEMTHFYEVGTIILNDPMADLLLDTLKITKFHSEHLDSLMADLLGEDHEDLPEKDDEEPKYDYAYFMHKNIININRPMAALLSKAIFGSSDGATTKIPPAVWSLRHQLENLASGRLIKPAHKEVA